LSELSNSLSLSNKERQFNIEECAREKQMKEVIENELNIVRSRLMLLEQAKSQIPEPEVSSAEFNDMQEKLEQLMNLLVSTKNEYEASILELKNIYKVKLKDSKTKLESKTNELNALQRQFEITKKKEIFILQNFKMLLKFQGLDLLLIFKINLKFIKRKKPKEIQTFKIKFYSKKKE